MKALLANAYEQSIEIKGIPFNSSNTEFYGNKDNIPANSSLTIEQFKLSEITS